MQYKTVTPRFTLYYIKNQEVAITKSKTLELDQSFVLDNVHNFPMLDLNVH